MPKAFSDSISQRLALLIYSMLWLMLLPFAAVHFIFQCMRKKHGYNTSRLSRFGIERTANVKPNGVLIHCASVGEVVAIASLVEQLLHHRPEQCITITTNTTTGADRVKLLFAGRVSHAYLPYDFAPFTWLFLIRRRPSVLLINEMELWPNLIHQCWRANIPVHLINARMTNKSLNTYQKFPALFYPMFAKIKTICAQGQRDYANYLQLGVDSSQLVLTNNIKFDLSISEHDLAQIPQLLDTFAIKERSILVAGSTHEPEEQLLLEAYTQLAEQYPALLLIIVPRHPQRFEKVTQLLQKRSVNFALMSDSQATSPATQVLLCDQMGKLRSVYGLADFCFVGGSIAQRGGHNALEPAAFGLPIMMGKSTYNNPAICDALHTSGALTYVNDAQEIKALCQAWLADPQQAEHLGAAGKQVIKDNSGAIAKTLAVLDLH